MKPWLHTRTGKMFDLVNPKVDQVSILDIAHSLSRLCRYTGHSDRHYSVAEHSVLVSYHVPEGMEMMGLMHDAHEAYTGDVASPIKMAVGPAWRSFENRIEAVVRSAFGLPVFDWPPEIKETDTRMLLTEAPQLLTWPPPRPWGIDGFGYPIALSCWSAEDACSKFLNRYNELKTAL